MPPRKHAAKPRDLNDIARPDIGFESPDNVTELQVGVA